MLIIVHLKIPYFSARGDHPESDGGAIFLSRVPQSLHNRHSFPLSRATSQILSQLPSPTLSPTFFYSFLHHHLLRLLFFLIPCSPLFFFSNPIPISISNPSPLSFSSYSSLWDMNPTCRFSSSIHTSLPRPFLLRNSHPFLPHNTSALLFNPLPSPPKPSFTFLRINNSKLTHPFATLPSFAEAEGEEKQKQEIQLNGQHQVNHDDHDGNDHLPGIAQAFHISPSEAYGISICIAFAALASPFFMKSLGQGLALKTKLLSYVTLLFGFYMAWNIGANDVANAMGTSVGSGALTLRQAVLTAGVLEFSGALLMGTHVTSTMQKGILVTNMFHGKDTLLLAGLLSSLAAAGSWLQVTSTALS